MTSAERARRGGLLDYFVGQVLLRLPAADPRVVRETLIRMLNDSADHNTEETWP